MPARYRTIASWVRENAWTSGAELGVADGTTLEFLMRTCPELKMLGVDVWNERAARPGKTFSNEKCRCKFCAATKESRRRLTMEQREQRARGIAEKYGRAKLLKVTTNQASRTVSDGAFDFVFIDADHSFEGVSGDIADWMKKVRPGGRLIGHDFNMESVRSAVYGQFSGEQVNEEDDHLWWVQL